METTKEKVEFLKDILKKAYPQNDSVDASKSKRGIWHFWEGVDNPMQHGSGAKCQLTDEVVDILIKRRHHQSTSQKEMIERLREGFLLAKKYIDECPCDPDIYPEQLEAWNRYQGFLKKESEQLLSTTEPIDQ